MALVRDAQSPGCTSVHFLDWVVDVYRAVFLVVVVVGVRAQARSTAAGGAVMMPFVSIVETFHVVCVRSISAKQDFRLIDSTKPRKSQFATTFHTLYEVYIFAIIHASQQCS